MLSFYVARHPFYFEKCQNAARLHVKLENFETVPYRGRLFSNAVAKIMEIFSNRQEAAFGDVLRIIIRW